MPPACSHPTPFPGDNATLTVELHTAIPLAEGQRFAVREGGRTVGAGVVAKLLE